MNIASARVMLTGLPRSIFEAHSAEIDAALRQLPLVSFATNFDEGGKFGVDVEYDGDDPELEAGLLNHVIDTVEGAIPADVRTALEPPSFTDAILGKFYWEEGSGWEGEAPLSAPNADDPLTLATRKQADPVDGLVERARAIAADFARFDRQWKDGVVRELFAIHNAKWNEDEPRSEDEFRDELRFIELSLQTDGGTTVVYFAGDLFREHDVELILTPNGQATANLIG